ncbi:MAG: type II toxin-antitoxin system RelE/ParE family toxin [Puniceicoccales bacterium]|nr:type II toxin-antitoxin system RelE/ParE family toxin [Puniceicoccales bacterium]
MPTEIQQRAHNRLHLLGGDLKGRWSISINEQWRITFRRESNGPAEVKIEGYH